MSRKINPQAVALSNNPPIQQKGLQQERGLYDENFPWEDMSGEFPQDPVVNPSSGVGGTNPNPTVDPTTGGGGTAPVVDTGGGGGGNDPVVYPTEDGTAPPLADPTPTPGVTLPPLPLFPDGVATPLWERGANLPQGPSYMDPNEARARAITGSVPVNSGNSNSANTGGQSGEFVTEQASQSGRNSNEINTSETTNLSGVVDTMGGGDAAQRNLTRAEELDLARAQFLAEMMGEDPNLVGDTDRAVRQALSGPGMQRSGINSQSRAAGYAGAEVANQSAERQLMAAQLAGQESAVGSALQGLLPFLQTESTSTGSSQSAGQEATFSNQQMGGQSSGDSWGINIGNAPVSKGGMCMVTTAMLRGGVLRTPRVIKRAVQGKLSRRDGALLALGYYSWGVGLTRFFLTHPKLSKPLKGVCKMILWEELRVTGCPHTRSRGLLPWVVHQVFHWTCVSLGGVIAVVRGSSHFTLPSDLAKVAQEHNVLVKG